MNPFRSLSLDQNHTLATALGNAVKSISEARRGPLQFYPETCTYMDTCIDDNEELLLLVNDAINFHQTCH